MSDGESSESTYDPASLEGVPEAGRARLQQNRAGLFTSDLSVNEFLLIKEAGFTLGETLAPGVRISHKHFTLVADGPEATAAAFADASALVAARVLVATEVRLTAEPDLIGELLAYRALTSKSNVTR